MKTSEVFRKAGDVLRERGWCQRSFSTARGACCAWGALKIAICGTPNRPTHQSVLEFRALKELGDVALAKYGVAPWNDDPSRTAVEVMIAMGAAYVVALQEEDEDPADYEVL